MCDTMLAYHSAKSFSFKPGDCGSKTEASQFPTLKVHQSHSGKMAAMVVMCEHALKVRQAAAAPQETTSAWNPARSNYVFVEPLL